MKHLIIFSLFVFSFALASHFTGTYTLPTDQGGVILSLEHNSDGSLTGVMEGAGNSMVLEGFADPDGGYGDISSPDGVIAFEVYLNEDDSLLGLYFFEYDASGEPDVDTVQEYVFERQSYTANLATPASATPTTATANNNPLAPTQPANPLGAGNPLAQTDPLVGRFSDNAVALTLQGGNGTYSGQLEFNAQTFPITAQGSAEGLTGSFESGGNSFPFEAQLQGNTLSFATGGTSYTLSKAQEPSNPLASNNANLNIKQPDPQSPVLVQGQYASLTQDNALAFVEALEFSLSQIGYAYSFSEAEKQQMYAAIVQEYPVASKEDQLVLAQARDIWNRVQVNWASSSPQDQQTFILGVLVLAFGEETVQQNLGQSGQATASSGGGSLPCSSVDTCMSTLDPDGYSDMVAAQGCWASAGCESYDSSTDTYTYDDFSYDSYSYDSY